MLSVSKGACHNIFVYDIAFSIDLNEAERRITSFKQREVIKHKRPAPQYFAYRSAPLRISQDTGPAIVIGEITTNAQVELVAYDFGAVCVIYRIALDEKVSDLLSLSQRLYENEQLLSDSRRRVEELLGVIGPAVTKSNVAAFVEDYLIFHVAAFQEPVSIADLTTRYAARVAQILRAEPSELSADEISDALSHRISYSRDDVTVVDWNAALVVDKSPQDVMTVLEFANVELLEMRFLDQRLDDALTRAYELSRRPQKWFSFRSVPADLRDISQWQVDSAILFEGVNNVLKLLGDQYMARLYRLVAQRFHLTDWDSSIFRKLETLERIYEKISDQMVTRRMEVLEWIIIVLIAVSIILPFFSLGK